MPSARRNLRLVQFALTGCVLIVGACGGSGRASSPDPSVATAGSHTASAAAGSAAAVPSGDWPTFDFNPQRSGSGPANTGVTAHNVRSLAVRRVHLDGTVDSAAIELHAIRVGGRLRDLIVVTTTYGKTIGIDAGSGARLWEYTPPSYHSYAGTAQVTTATPVADPDRRYVYAAEPDGLIRKLSLSTGRVVSGAGWPVRVTLDPTREKIASALNLSGPEVIVTTGGYIGDEPTYQGHVVTFNRATGRVIHVWNSLCAEAHQLIVPRTCGASDSAIWARAGAVVEPGSGRLLVTTGNATIGATSPFDGRRFWPDTVLELTPDAARLLHNWTPSNQAQLSRDDVDLGSTAPALLGTVAGRRLAVQGGKDGRLHLLDLGRLNGTTGPAGPRLGGELSETSTPGGADLFSAPAVWTHGGRTFLYVADQSGTAVFDVAGAAKPRLHQVAANTTPGTSPIVAGGLAYIYDHVDGKLEVYAAGTLTRVASLRAAPGHWNSPIAVGGRVVLPEGNYQDRATSGTLDIFHVAGR